MVDKIASPDWNGQPGEKKIDILLNDEQITFFQSLLLWD